MGSPDPAILDVLAANDNKSKLASIGINALNAKYAQKDAIGVLRTSIADLLANNLAVVSSYGADSAVLLHMISNIAPDLPVLFLNTGMHFPETLTYVKTLSERLGLTNVRMLSPDSGDLVRFDPTSELWQFDPDSCCHIRKTEPLETALREFGGWVTGRRRSQTEDRGGLARFELTSDDRIKVNPLAFWDNSDVVQYKKQHDLPEHPLLVQGFHSIGCAPCTSAVKSGEDARAGRWRGFNKAECGIHFDVNKRISPAMSQVDLTLFKDGKFIDDPWDNWTDDNDPRSARYVHVPVAVFEANRNEFLASPHPLGLLVSAGESIEGISSVLSRFASVAIEFPAFTDGRGYSTARLLVERFGYEGEVRAIGDILTDQIAFLRRCGVNAFVVKHGATRKALETDALGTIEVFMQPVGANEAPVSTRPFLRRANP